MRSFLFLALFASVSSQASLVEFRLSKLHGLLNFAETLGGRPHRAGALKDAFEKSSQNTPEVKKAIAKIMTAYANMKGGFDYGGFPLTRTRGVSSEQFLLIQSIYAKDLLDLETRSTGVLPVAALRELMSAFKTLLPIYEQVIWNPSLKKMELKKLSLAKAAQKADVDEMFRRAVAFYRSGWPPNVPFVMAMYPIPGGSGHSAAESFVTVESVGILVDEKDDAGRFGVMFHEMCHSLYAAQPAEVQKEFESWFKDAPDAYGVAVHFRIDEILATLWGNGLAAERAAGGKPDGGNWYNDKYIDGGAKAIYPTLKRYFNENRAVDREFIKEATAKFKEKFPSSANEYNCLFNRIVLNIDSSAFDSVAVKTALSKAFNISSKSNYGKTDDMQAIDELKETDSTGVYVVTPENRDRLARVFSELPLDAGAKLRQAQSGSLLRFERPGGRAVFVIVAAKTADVLTAVDSMKAKGSF